MTWLRIDDTFPEHPKVVGLDAPTKWLHVCALAYASRNLTDGYIPAGALRGLGGTKRMVAALVDAGLWEGHNAGGEPANYLIHDYLDYNRSRKDVEEEREAAKTRMKRARNGKRSADVPANKERSS